MINHTRLRVLISIFTATAFATNAVLWLQARHSPRVRSPGHKFWGKQNKPPAFERSPPFYKFWGDSNSGKKTQGGGEGREKKPPSQLRGGSRRPPRRADEEQLVETEEAWAWEEGILVDRRTWLQRIQDSWRDLEFPEFETEHVFLILGYLALLVSACAAVFWLYVSVLTNPKFLTCVASVLRCRPCVSCCQCFVLVVYQLVCCTCGCLIACSCDKCDPNASPRDYGIIRKPEPPDETHNLICSYASYPAPEISGRGDLDEDLGAYRPY